MRALWLRFLLWLITAKRLNLHVHKGHTMAKIGDTSTATIAPVNAAGLPAPVTGAVYVDGASYDVAMAADGLSCVFTAKAAGTGNTVTVTAVNLAGATLTDSASLPDVIDDVAVKLNLTVA